jgi:hypothetical protein
MAHHLGNDFQKLLRSLSGEPAAALATSMSTRTASAGDIMPRVMTGEHLFVIASDHGSYHPLDDPAPTLQVYSQ